MTRIIFHAKAKEDFRSGRDWYRAVSLDLEQRFIRAVDVAIDRAERHFDSFERVTSKDRRIRVEDFPYCIIVRRLDPSTLLVVSVSHQSRRPRFWRRRR